MRKSQGGNINVVLSLISLIFEDFIPHHIKGFVNILYN